MNSMKRTMWPVPRKWRAIGTIACVVDAALDHHVDLDRREARGRGGVDALEHALDRKVDVVHRAERRVVERVEAHGDALQAGVAQRARLLREQRAVGGQREVEAADAPPASRPGVRCSGAAAARRRSAGSSRRRAPTNSAGDARDFLERQQLGVRQERVVASEDVLRHAVDAAEVAAVGDRDAQVVQRPSARVARAAPTARPRPRAQCAARECAVRADARRSVRGMIVAMEWSRRNV